MNAPRRTALVTGASSGLGRELAHLLAIDGYDLLLVARRLEPLRDLAGRLERDHGIRARWITQDLAGAGAAEALWAIATLKMPPVDVLVNCAGVGIYGRLAEADGGALARMLHLNIGTLTQLTRLALPGMVKRGWGRVLNVASLAATQPGGPRMAAYYASKAYVLSFSRGLSRELRGTGVSVTALCPGPMDTDFERAAGAAGTVLYARLSTLSATVVARAGYLGLQRGSVVVTPGLLTKLLAFAGALPPRRVALEVNHWLLSDA